MDEAGGIKVMGLRMERASTFSSVHNPRPGQGRGLSRHFSNVSTSSNAHTTNEKGRFSSFSFPKQLGFGAKEE